MNAYVSNPRSLLGANLTGALRLGGALSGYRGAGRRCRLRHLWRYRLPPRTSSRAVRVWGNAWSG